jgi:zinc transport system permease protein
MIWTDWLAFGFVQRAILAGSFIAVLCAVLGVFLVLRRLSLIGDGLAHATFGSAALALWLQWNPLYVSIPFVMVSALGILKLTERTKLYGDAAIGVVSAVGIAGGVLIAGLAGGFNVDLFSFLFGSILTIGPLEVAVSVVLSSVVVLAISLFYQELLSVTFDEESARASGIRADRINRIFGLLTAVAVVLSMKVVGVLLISALLILPAVTALQLTRSFRATMAVAAGIAVLSVLSGIFLSFALDLPSGATIVLINVLFLVAGLALRRRSGGRGKNAAL